jgi:mono/diheme cytochrome c family protein
MRSACILSTMRQMRSTCGAPRRKGQLLALGTLAGALVVTSPTRAESRGELLYSTHCISCHTSQMHWRDKKRATNWNSLKTEVRRWQGNAMLEWSDKDILEVTHYLNNSFYRFSQTSDPTS